MAKQKPLTEIIGYRGKEAMDEEAAQAIAMRVKIHLLRGSIEQARHALEDGWRSHADDTAGLPIGLDVLDVPLSRVVEEYRPLNMLEKEGILTVKHLLEAVEAGELYSIPNMGPVTVAKLVKLSEEMRERAKS